MKTKNIRLSNVCVTMFCEQRSDQEFLKELNKLKNKPLSYYIFQREQTEEIKEHWQCYFEFHKQQYLTTLKKIFGNLAHIESRKGTQEEAIKYCKKEFSKIGSTYEWGKRKEKTKEKIKAKKKTLKGVIEAIKNKNFNDFEEIINEIDILEYFKWQNLLKNAWEYFNPINPLEIKPARVIWLFGEAGSGKSCWTKKYLRQHNLNSAAYINPQNMSYTDKVYFDPSYEAKQVLVLNEVDKEFPKHNNLIAFIDRTTLLNTKGSYIRNKFELIIINSIYKPEQVFSYLGKKNASQILRRIFNPYLNCLVYEVKTNKKQLRLAKKLNLTEIDFQEWYKPIVIEIKEPDYSLIKKD